MCAIAGCVHLPLSRQTIEQMLETMRRRGPDGQGIFQAGACTLLHSRLAIIDPQGGRQPMTLEYGQEEYTLVYNGELYNTREIRLELERTGHHFLGHSDTEVVLHAYAQWGPECVTRFNGIFAFAVWERRAERLFLARDRIGVKPLFYTQLENGLLFASEIKTIFCHPGVRPELDAQGAYQLLLLGPGRIPGSEGAVNFAFLGQFAEMPRDTVFTTEYSMRTAMVAVYTLLNVDRGVPEVWGSLYDLRDLLAATVSLRDGKPLTEMNFSFLEKIAVKMLLEKIRGTDIEKLLKEYHVIE